MSHITDEEVFGYIVKQWQMENTVDRIMMSLLCLGKPVTREAILLAILVYCDSQSENTTYRAKARE